jgi:hypothetical protein
MNFAGESFSVQLRRKSGSVWRNALATTNSEDGISRRMVLSHDPNESHEFGISHGEVLEQSLGDNTCLNEDAMTYDVLGLGVGFRLLM